jgi:hypothetical protein
MIPTGNGDFTIGDVIESDIHDVYQLPDNLSHCPREDFNFSSRQMGILPRLAGFSAKI